MEMSQISTMMSIKTDYSVLCVSSESVSIVYSKETR
jgi:hypothetical protein